MKKTVRFQLTLMLGLLFSAKVLMGQALISNYSFSSNTSTTLEDLSTGSTSLLTGNQDDVASAVNAIGFDFYFGGVRYTHFSANSNGQMQLHTISTATAISSTAITAYTASTPILFPMSGDNEVNGGMKFKVIGSTFGSRKLVVEWTQFYVYYTNLTNAGNMQVWLDEASGNVTYVYGEIYNSSSATTARAPALSFGSTATTAGYVTVAASPSFTASATLTTNTFAAGSGTATGSPLIANLGSSVSGSRRAYVFAPGATTAPSGLNFTNVGLTTTTLNWTDNSTAEVGYVIYRSTDNVNFTYVTTTAAGATSYAATGLNGATTYYWKLYVLRESLGSAVNGSQATASCPTYSGTMSVGPTSATFPNLSTAISNLTACGYTGNIILELQSGYLSSGETFPLTFGSGLGASSTKTITIRPASAATNLSITSNNATATVDLNGGSYITIDGRPGGAGTTSQLSIGNTGAAPAVRFINDAANNTVKYVTVTSTVTSTTSGLIAFSTTTGANGNDNNTIDNCDLNGAGTAANIIYASGTTTSTATNNSGNTISNCTIRDQFVAGSATNGILIAGGNTDWTISGNHLYQTASRTFTTGSTHIGININNTGNNFNVTGNYIGGGAINCGGTAWTIGGTVANRFQAILLSVGTTTASSIQGNVISNINFSSSSGATTLPGVWSAIYIAAGSANIGTITGNTVGATTGTGNISATCSTNGGVSVGIGNASTGTVSISNNNLGSISVLGSSTTISHTFYGIWNSAAATSLTISANVIGSTTTANSINAATAVTGTTAQMVNGIYNSGASTALTISNNTIANLNSAYAPATASSSPIVIGIRSTAGPNTISGNTIRNLSTAALSTSVTQNASVIGILVNSAAANNINQNTIYSCGNSNNSSTNSISVIGILNFSNSTGSISRNNIYGLTNSSTFSSSTIYGIMDMGSTSALSIENNMLALGAGFEGSVYGIYAAGVNNYYFNSIYIGGAPTVTTSNSYAFLSICTTGTRNILNNIFVNGRSNNGATGKHYGIQISSSTAGYTGITSNFNIIRATGTGGFLGLNAGTPNDISTLSSWQSTTGKDANSYNSDPMFVNPTASTPDLHINNSVGTVAEGTGTNVATVSVDFDGQTRSGLTPVDIGADAGLFIASTPQISLSSITPAAATQCSATNRNVIVSVTTPSGTISSVTLNYSHNGTAQTAITMNNTSGNSYSGTMLAPSTSNATVTWTVTAINSLGFSSTYTGTSFSDNPNVGITATASAGNTSICSGANSSLSVVTSKPGNVDLGTATTLTSATTQPTAFCNRWAGHRSQTIFTAAELTASGLGPGNITAMAYNITTLGDAATNASFTVNIGNTSLNAFSATTFESITGYTNCFPSATYTHTSSGWQTINFTTPFNWDGVSNIIVDVSMSGANLTNNSITYYTATTGNSVLYTTSTLTGTVTLSNTRLNVRFSGNACPVPSAYSWSNGTSVVGITNPLVQSPTSTTSYTCTATVNSCPVVSNSVSVTVNNLPTAPTATNSSQCGAGTPTCSVSGSSNGNYRWYTVQTGGTALSGQNNSTLSNYSVSATTTFYVSIWNGTCESNRTAVTVTVSQPDAIVAAASNTNLTCLGNSTSLSVSQANTNNAYSFTWSSTTGSGLTNGTTTTLNSTVAVTPTVAGTYVYTITGSEASTGCQATSTVSVVVNNPVATVSATASVNNPTICNGNSINLSLNLTRPDVSVGSGASTIVNTYANPFYSNWNNNKTQVLYLASELQSAGLTAGNLSALVMSLTAGNVSSREGLTISIGTTNATSLSTTFLTPTFTQVYYSTGYVPIIGSNTFTFGTGVGSTSSFTWDGSSNLVIQFCWDVIASTATRNSTCVSDNTSFASVVSYNRTSTTGTSICSGTFVGSATYTTRPRFTFVSSPVASQLSWSNGVSVVGSTASLSQSPSSTTTYTCTATVSSCPVSSNAVNVTVNPLPIITASVASSSICPGTSTTLSGSGGSTYSWSPATNLSSTTGSPTFTSSTSGNVTYTVTGTDANACSNTAQVTVTVIAPPAAVSVTGTSPSCNNTTLTASGGAGGSIYFQGTTSNGNSTSTLSSSETVSSSGTYYFRSYDGSCFGEQGSLTVVINTQPVITQDPSNLGETICQNVANFTPLSVVATGSNLTYQWYENTTASNSNGISISGATTASYTPMNTIAGTKYYYCVVSSSSCPSTNSAVSGPLTVTAGPSAPIVDYSSLTVNVGASATFTGQRSSASNTLTWWTSASGGTEIDPDNTTSVDSVFNSYLASILSNPSTSVAFCTPGLTAQTTTYKYYVQQSDGTCPSLRTEVKVLTNNLFSNIPSNLLICQAGGSVDLVANIIPLANQSFQWMSSTTGSNYSNVSGATNASLNANPQVTTNFKLSMDLTPLGCLTPLTTSQVFAVGVLPPNNFAPSASPSAICVGETSTLSSNLSTGNFSVTSIPFAPSTQPNTGVTTLSTGGAATVPLSGGDLDDGGWGGIPIGFTYNFFGNNFTSLGVGTNGLVMFGAIPGYTTATGELGQYSFSSPTFPNSLNPGNIIGLMLSDMRFSTANGGNGVLKYWNDGIAPTRRFVLSGTYPQYSGGALTIVQLILYETTGIAEVHITSSASTISRSVGLQSAIPVPVATPTGAMAPGWNGRTTTLSTPESWRFTPGANYSYQWYLGSNLNTAIAGATSTSYTTTTGQSATSGQKTYTIAATNPTTQCASSQQIMITVNALPALPVSGGNVTACSNASSAILSATPPSSATVKWFDGSGNAVGTGNNLTVNPSTLVNGSTTYPLTLTYYAKSYSNTSCYSSGQGTAVNLVINEAPSAPSALQTAFTYCEGQSATQLAASAGAGNTLNWYTASLSSQPSSIAPTPNTSTNSGSPFAYYATQVSGVNGCESNSTSFTITVNNTPAAPAYVNGGNGNVSYCQGATTQAISSSLATLTGTNYYLYYTVPTGGTGTTSAIVPSSTSAGTTTFYVSRMTVAGCEGARTPITVVINPSLTASVAISASSTTVCQNGSIDFTATPTNGGPSPTYAWFLNGTQVGTASTYSLANPLNGDAIYVNMVSNEPSCLFAANATSSTISLGNSSVTPSVSIVQSTGTTICAGTSVSYSVLNSMNIGSSPTYNWKVNGVTQSTTSTLTTTTLANNDVVTLVMTSSLSSSCLTSTSATSNAISMTVTPVTAFTNQPANTSVCLGASSSLSATAIGTGNISYQWQSSITPTGTYNNITYVSNSTALSAGLTIPTVTSATSYRLVATSSCGSATSNVATISINQATAITQQPLTQTVCEGSQVTFSVSALGTGSISYQWRKNGTAISGANAATYSISNLTSANAGQYSVVVSATCGSVTSSNAQLIVTPLTTISAQPTGVTVCEGNNVSLTVTATGTGNLTYQWYQNGTALTTSSATTDQFVTNGALNDAGSYTVVVTGTCSSVTSNAVNVVVNQNTAITTQPTAFTGCAFSPAALSVSAVGTNLGYQWNYAGAPITGANSSTYSISSPVTSNSGSYTVDVLGTCGNITSNSAVMTINGLPILSAIVGGNNGVCSGSSITLTNPTSNGLWSTNNNSIATINANGVLTGVSVGTVTVTYTYTNNLGCTNSVTKQIQVKALPTVAIQTPLATTICQGESMSLTSSIAISYLWNNGATGQSILVNSTTPGTANYSVTIVGANGCSATSSPIAISIIAVPSIAAITGSGNFPTYCLGSTGTLSNATPNGLWTTSNSNVISINASTGAISALTNGTATISYNVNNMSGCLYAYSATATAAITVTAPAAVVTANGSTTFCQGGNVGLSASSGTGYSYLWSNNATAQNVSATASGSYSVTVTAPNGCTSTSAPTFVTVLSNPNTTIIPAGPINICAGSSVTLSSGNALSYSWTNGANTPTITVNTAGNYGVTLTGANGCSATSNLTVVNVIQLPGTTIATSGPTSICDGSSVTLTGPTASSYLWSTGATTQSINATATGNYSLTASNGNCSTNATPVSVQLNPVPSSVITSSGPTTFCAGGSVTLSAPTGSALTYQWSNGATTQSIVVTTSGSYTVTVSNAFNCSSTSTPSVVQVNALPSASITASGSTSICSGNSVNLSAAAANSYLWSNGSTTQTISVSNAGNYTVQTYSAQGCTATSIPTTVSILSLPTTLVSQGSSTTFCQGGNVQLSASNASSYVWSNGATTQNILASSSGNYTVTVIGSNGCSATSTGITVSVLPAPTASINPGTAVSICSGTSVTLSTNTATSYAWSTGATSPTIQVTTAGNYTVTLTGSNGCTATSPVTVVTLIPTPIATISASGTTTICPGSSISLSAPTASSYLWNTGATTQSIQVSNAGSYSVTVGSSGCFASSSNTLITYQQQPTAAITSNGPTTFCQGGTVGLSAATSNGNSFLWSNGATTQNIVAATGGQYTVTVTNLYGCSATSSAQTVTVNSVSVPVISANGPTALCPGLSVGLSTSAAASYLWSNGATTQNISVSNAGSYTVTVTNVSGCSATSLPIQISANPSPVATISSSGSTTFCQGSSVQLTANAGSTYLWNTGATTQAITAASTGSYTVVVTNSSGCAATSSPMQVTVQSAPTAYINPGTTIGICSGTSVTLSTNSATSYAWSTGATSPTIQVTTAGNYTVTLTGTNGCSATSPVTVVSIVASPTASITAVGGTTICQGSSTVLTASTSTSYLWNTGQTTQSIQVSLAGSYAVTVGSNGCSATSPSTFISYNPNPIATVSANGPTTFCQGNSVSLSAPSGNGNSYLWNTGATTQSINTSVAGNFNVVVTNGYGCSTTSNSSSVVVNPLPVMTPITGSNSICAGAQGQVTNAMTGGVYASSNLGIASIGQLNGQITGLTAGSTMITYLYTNSNGCSNSVTYPVTIIPAPVSSIVAGGPTTFCQGGNVTLTASPGTSYVWNTGATTSSIPVTTSGNYSVTITGSNGCSTTSINTNVNVLSPSPVSAINGANAVCVNSSISLTNQTSGGVWSSSNPSVATISSNGVVTGVSAGTSTISYSINSTNGCPNSVTKLVTVNAIPSTALSASSATTFCQGGSVQLNASPGVSYLWSNGATNASITVSTAGSYSVQVTSASGCISSSSVQQVSVLSNPTAVISSNGPTTICTGSTVTLMATPNASYLWSNNATTSSINVTSSGSYFVTVTNSSGCSTTSASTNITVNNLPSAVLTANGPTTVCSGNSVSLSVPNNPAYSYQWKLNGTVIPNALSNTYTASASGTYSVVVTNSSNCFVESNSISVVVNSTPVASISAGGSTTFCQGSSVILTAVNASSYQWSNGATSQSIVANTSGSYSVLVSNSNGCTASSNVLTVNVNSVPNATVSANGPTTICSGSNVVLTASPGASYLWNNGATTSSITVNTTGSYSVSVFNSNGCSNTSNSTVITVNSPSVASVSTSGSTTFCAGGSVNLTASNAVSYLWNTGQTTQAILVNTSGAYSVTLTNASGCTSTSAVTNVISYSAPVATITANGSTSICQGGSVQLNASPGVSYLWSNGATSSAINVTTAGNYTVQVTNSNGCVANSSVTSITVNANPIASISANGPLSICAGNNVVLTASPGASYLWSNGATSSSIVANVSANYTVQVTNAVGCSSTSSGTSVVVNAVPTPSITSQGSTTICQGSSVVLSTAATSGSTYQWKNNGTNIPLATAATYLTNAAGNYTVQVTNAAGCSATSNVTAVVVNSLPVASITNAGSNAICAGSSAVLTASLGSSYLWNNGATSASISVSTAGSYSVNITNAAGCSNSASINISVLNPIVANISSSGPTTFCIGQSVVLTATPGSAYLWNTGATTSSISVANAGNYSVQLTGANGCVSTSSVVAISTISLPTSSISASGPTTFCQGSSVVLTASPGSSYLWSNGETSGSIVATNTGNYHVTVYNSAGCALTSQVVPVQVNSAPSATITANGSTGLCQGSSVVLTASPGSSYTWNTGESTASITVSNAGNYFATITNSNGCSSVSNVLPITVSIAPNATIQVQGSSTICQGSNVLLVTSGGANYSWTNGSTTASILVNSSGNYGVTVSNAQGCSVTLAPVSIVVNPSPVLSSISGNASVCVGANTVFSNNTPSGVWTSDNSAVASVNTSGLVTGVNAGSTLIHYAVTNSNGCSASVTKAIQVNANPVATISSSGSTTFCQGNNVTLTAPSGLTYQWMNGSSNQSITVSNSGVYSVQVYNANGCSTNSNSINVTVNPLPTVSISSPSNTLCLGSNLLLSASLSGANYIWNTGATSQQINVSTGGNYSVVITDQNGCSASSTTTITNGTPPQASISTSGPTSFCQGGSVILSGSGGNSYTWNNGSTSQNLTVTSTGVYSVMVTNANGCSSYSNPISVNVQQAPNASIVAYGPTTFCAGGSVNLACSGGGTYAWSNAATTQGISATTSGVYQLVITGTNGCTSTSNAINVTVLPVPTALITPSGSTTFCEGGSVDLVASGGTSYAWSNNQTTSTITAVSGGVYTVTVSNGACSNSISQLVTVNENPSSLIVVSGLTTFCQGGQVSLTAQPGNTYLWSTNETTQTIVVNAAGTYGVSLQGVNGCTSNSNVLTVVVNQPTTSVVNATGLDSYTLNGILYTQSGTYTQTQTNVAGCDSTITLNLTLTVGLNEGKLTDVKIYPNPTSESFTILTEMPIFGAFAILDAQGKLVYSGEMNGLETQVNLSTVARGIYYIRIPELTEPLRVVKN